MARRCHVSTVARRARYRSTDGGSGPEASTATARRSGRAPKPWAERPTPPSVHHGRTARVKGTRIHANASKASTRDRKRARVIVRGIGTDAAALASSAMIEVTQSTFDAEVLQSDKPVV